MSVCVGRETLKICDEFLQKTLKIRDEFRQKTLKIRDQYRQKTLKIRDENQRRRPGDSSKKQNSLRRGRSIQEETNGR